MKRACTCTLFSFTRLLLLSVIFARCVCATEPASVEFTSHSSKKLRVTVLHWAHAATCHVHFSGGFGLRLGLRAAALPAARHVADRLDVRHNVDRRRPRLPLEPDRLVPLLQQAALGVRAGGQTQQQGWEIRRGDAPASRGSRSSASRSDPPCGRRPQ